METITKANGRSTERYHTSIEISQLEIRKSVQFAKAWRIVQIMVPGGSIERGSDPNARHINQWVIAAQPRRQFRKLASFDFAAILILGEATGKVDEIGDRGAGVPGLTDD